MAIMFELDEDQIERANKFSKEHECPFKESGVGAIGGRISYRFTMTGLGIIEVVECACGKSLNLTDFESW